MDRISELEKQLSNVKRSIYEADKRRDFIAGYLELCENHDLQFIIDTENHIYGITENSLTQLDADQIFGKKVVMLPKCFYRKGIKGITENIKMLSEKESSIVKQIESESLRNL